MTVVATAGHVDHGKSTLVRAMTGTDPDRWAEERERGMTIDLGFAATTLPSGAVISFVDVPGHVRFLKNMLAGVGAVEAVMFVVAATEGWKPQSEEHLRILELLGATRGVIAVTMIDLVDADGVELACLDVAEHVAGTFLGQAEIVPANGRDPSSLTAVRAALDRVASMVPAAADHDRARLWIDRSFTLRGVGTVVTGVLTGGSIAVDDELVLTPTMRSVRVRGLQVHGRSLAHATPGERVAVNLAGVGATDVERGDALIAPDRWHHTDSFDARLSVLPSLDHRVSRRGAYALHLGSGGFAAKLRVLGSDAVEPGSSALVRIHIDRAVPILPGDRFVLRESGRDETVGGGEILDVDPIVAANRARPSRSISRVVAERGWVDVRFLERLTGVTTEATVGRWAVDPSRLDAIRTDLRDRCAGAPNPGLPLAEMNPVERAVAATLAGLHIVDGHLTPSEPATEGPGHPFLVALEAAPFCPPEPDPADRATVAMLVRQGLIVRTDGVLFARSAIEAAVTIIASLLDDHPEGVTVAHVRDALGSSRRHVIPLLAHLDATARTRREGDVRVAGPRLEQRTAGETSS